MAGPARMSGYRSATARTGHVQDLTSPLGPLPKVKLRPAELTPDHLGPVAGDAARSAHMNEHRIHQIFQVSVLLGIGNFVFGSPGRYALFEARPYSAIAELTFAVAEEGENHQGAAPGGA